MLKIDEEPDELSGEEEQALYEHHNIKVEKGQVSMRIDKFIMIRVAHTTRTKIQNACDEGRVLVNGKSVKSNYKTKPFDEISIRAAAAQANIKKNAASHGPQRRWAMSA